MPRRLPLRHQAPRSVDNHARDLLVLARAALRRDAHVDARTPLVGEAMELGRSRMAEYGTRPYAQHRRPQPRLPGRIAGERGVGSAVQALPGPRAELPFDGLPGETRVACLFPGDDPGLAMEQPPPLRVVFVFHRATLDGPAAARHDVLKPVDNLYAINVDRYSCYGRCNDPRCRGSRRQWVKCPVCPEWRGAGGAGG